MNGNADKVSCLLLQMYTFIPFICVSAEAAQRDAQNSELQALRLLSAEAQNAHDTAVNDLTKAEVAAYKDSNRNCIINSSSIMRNGCCCRCNNNRSIACSTNSDRNCSQDNRCGADSSGRDASCHNSAAQETQVCYGRHMLRELPDMLRELPDQLQQMSEGEVHRKEELICSKRSSMAIEACWRAHLDLEKRERELLAGNVNQLKASLESKNQQLILLQDVMMAQSKDIEREKKLLVKARASLQQDTDTMHSHIENTICIRLHVAADEAKAKEAESLRQLTSRAQEAEAKTTFLEAQLEKCAREARREALEEIAQLSAQLAARDAHIIALDTQIKRISHHHTTAHHISTAAVGESEAGKGEQSGGEVKCSMGAEVDIGSITEVQRLQAAEKQLRVESASLLLQIKALVAVSADHLAEKELLQTRLDHAMRQSVALKGQVDSLTREMIEKEKTEQHLSQERRGLMGHYEVQLAASHQKIAQVEAEKAEALERAIALNADAVFWRGKCVKLDEAHRKNVTSLERRCTKMQSFCMAECSYVAGLLQLQVRVRQDIETLCFELDRCRDLIAAEEREVEQETEKFKHVSIALIEVNFREIYFVVLHFLWILCRFHRKLTFEMS